MLPASFSLESHDQVRTIPTIKKIRNGYLDYPLIHLLSAGNNILYDDNASLRRAQVVTECFERHDNDVSHMTSVNRYDLIPLSIYR